MNEFLYPRFEKVRGYTGLHLSVVPIICPSFSLSVYHFVFFIRLYILQAKQRAYSQIFWQLILVSCKLLYTPECVFGKKKKKKKKSNLAVSKQLHVFNQTL